MLDVITVVSETTPKGYIGQCRTSIKRAASLCPFPVNVIETPGVPGNIGLAMHGGLAHGDAPYVVWVDDDDFVLPNAFLCLMRHFAGGPTGPTAIFAREVALLNNGRLRAQYRRHHLTAFRRDVLERMPMHEYTTYTSMDMRNYCEGLGGTVDELSWVYVYRIWPSPGRALRWGERNGR